MTCWRSNLTEAGTHEIAAFFERVDVKRKDGKITFGEFIEVFITFLPSSRPLEADIDRLCVQFGAQKWGNIPTAPALTAVPRLTKESRAILIGTLSSSSCIFIELIMLRAALFKRVDKNGDGFISDSELAAALKTDGQAASIL